MSTFESSEWSLITGGISAPAGFKSSGIMAGLKPSNKLDLALILAPADAVCVGTFTQSSVRAKCIDLCLERLKISRGKIRAVVVNSGQANACTGNRGLEDSLIATQAIATKLDIPANKILICSTGVIGEPIHMKNLLKGLDSLINELSDQSGTNAAKAILTTDLTKKEIAFEAQLGNRRVRIGAMAKGSGMIHPDMATMLGFFTCDASLPLDKWESMLRRVVDNSFNLISVDGDTSTNDAVLAFCAGASIEKEYFDHIELGLNIVAQYLAKAIVRDGEGANCLFEVKVEGAMDIKDARLIAKTICSSSLVKTAVHGCDPNWGRIIAAAGRAGISFNENQLSLWIGPFLLFESGLPVAFDKESVKNYMKEKLIAKSFGPSLNNQTIHIRIVIGLGNYEALAWGCDLSDQYVRINAEYTT